MKMGKVRKRFFYSIAYVLVMLANLFYKKRIIRDMFLKMAIISLLLAYTDKIRIYVKSK
jgi:hypothetical protein